MLATEEEVAKLSSLAHVVGRLAVVAESRYMTAHSIDDSHQHARGLANFAVFKVEASAWAVRLTRVSRLLGIFNGDNVL